MQFQKKKKKFIKLKVSYFQSTALQIAVEKKNMEIIQLLLNANGIKVNDKEKILLKINQISFCKFCAVLAVLAEKEERIKKMVELVNNK